MVSRLRESHYGRQMVRPYQARRVDGCPLLSALHERVRVQTKCLHAFPARPGAGFATEPVTFSENIRSKDYHTCRVLQPKRATLSIAEGSNGNRQIVRLKIKANPKSINEQLLPVACRLSRYSRLI